MACFGCVFRHRQFLIENACKHVVFMSRPNFAPKSTNPAPFWWQGWLAISAMSSRHFRCILSATSVAQRPSADYKSNAGKLGKSVWISHKLIYEKLNYVTLINIINVLQLICVNFHNWSLSINALNYGHYFSRFYVSFLWNKKKKKQFYFICIACHKSSTIYAYCQFIGSKKKRREM